MKEKGLLILQKPMYWSGHLQKRWFRIVRMEMWFNFLALHRRPSSLPDILSYRALSLMLESWSLFSHCPQNFRSEKGYWLKFCSKSSQPARLGGSRYSGFLVGAQTLTWKTTIFFREMPVISENVHARERFLEVLENQGLYISVSRLLSAKITPKPAWNCGKINSVSQRMEALWETASLTFRYSDPTTRLSVLL